MPAGDDSFERLRASLDELAIGDAAELLAEARVEARARVRSMLSEALAHSILEQAREQLDASSRRAQGTAGSDARRPRPSPPATVDQPERCGRELAWYVFCVVGAQDAPSTLELVGIDPRYPVTTVAQGAVAAVASHVPCEDFAEAPLRAHLADLEWVEGIARTHEGVVDALRTRTTVIPMRMCTVYRTEGGIREMLSRESHTLQETLDQLEGKTEWGVKVFFHPDRAPGAGEGADTASPDGTVGATGAAYMERRRHERDHKERLEHLIEQASAEIHQRLQALAADGLLNPSQRPEASGHPGEMLLNGVYLIEDEAQDRFHQEVLALQDGFAPVGLELVTSGPWPPYNFLPGTIGAAW
jgi:hypothetical protein